MEYPIKLNFLYKAFPNDQSFRLQTFLNLVYSVYTALIPLELDLKSAVNLDLFTSL